MDVLPGFKKGFKEEYFTYRKRQTQQQKPFTLRSITLVTLKKYRCLLNNTLQIGM